MSIWSATSHSNARCRCVAAHGSTAIALLLVCLPCLGLTACGTSSGGGGASAAKASEAHTTTNVVANEGGAQSPAGRRKIAELRTVLRCVRRHGVAVPEVSATGSIDMSGVNQSSHRYQVALQNCVYELKPETHLRQAAQREKAAR
jgi:hypothetical protein